MVFCLMRSRNLQERPVIQDVHMETIEGGKRQVKEPRFGEAVRDAFGGNSTEQSDRDHWQLIRRRSISCRTHIDLAKPDNGAKVSLKK